MPNHLNVQFWAQSSLGQQAIFLVVSLFGASLLSLLLKKIAKKVFQKESFREQFFNKTNRYVCSWLLTVVLLLPVYLSTFSSSLSLIYGIFVVLTTVLTVRLIRLVCSPVFKAPFMLLSCSACAIILTNHFFPSLQVLEKLTFNIGKTNISVLRLLKSIGVIAFFIWVALRLAKTIEVSLSKNSRIDKSAHILFSKLTKIGLLAFAFFLGTSLMGIDLFIITYFVGAIGIAVGLGLQNIISNVFCGILLLLDRSIKPGDVVSLHEKNAYGVIHSLNARYVSVRTRDGIEHLIPNEEFINKKTANWTHTDPFIRIPMTFKVGLDTNIDLLEEQLLKITSNVERVLKSPKPSLRVVALFENYIEVQLRLWISDPQNGKSSIKNQIFREAITMFKKCGIEIPRPPLDLYVQQRSEHLKSLKNMD
ncbi:MAG: hypothetical protein S4CHLAM6_04000 [Chlamydiae bacterium]|nr:hypothetical protein [Chlamydiota bacterium]